MLKSAPTLLYALNLTRKHNGLLIFLLHTPEQSSEFSFEKYQQFEMWREGFRRRRRKNFLSIEACA
jgi:hypothetical protein